MTTTEFKQKYPQHSHLEGNIIWDKMAEELRALNDTGLRYIETEDGFSKFVLTQRNGLEGEGDCENEYLTREEIAAKRLKRWKDIEEMRRNGTYGDLYDLNISMESDTSLNTSTDSSATSYRMEILDFSKLPERKKPEMKKYEIWIGFVGAWGQGDHDSTAPQKLGEVEATSFKIACCIYEHESAVKSLRQRMERGDTYIEDSWFGKWGYNPEDNSTFYLGKYYESEQEAWESFKGRDINRNLP